MAVYRTTRNIEASIIEHLKDSLESAWTNVNIEKSFAKIYTLSLPSVCVRIGRTDFDPAEIGDNKTIRTAQLLIDVFGDSAGLTLDLKEHIIEVLKDGCIYYEYTTKKEGRTTVIDTETANGKIRISEISDNAVNLDNDRDKLDIHDRFRWLITCNISLGRIE